MSYIPGRDVFGDANPFAEYEAMKLASAQAIADAAAHPAAPVEQYRDFSTGQDLTVAEGRRLLDASYRADAAANAASIASTPGYTGGGEDFAANEVKAQWAITHASQGYTPATAPAIPSAPIITALHPVVPPGQPNGSSTAGGTAGGGSSTSNPAGPSAAANYPAPTVTVMPSDRSRPVLAPATEPDIAIGLSTKTMLIGAGVLLGGLALFTHGRRSPQRRP